MSRRFFTSDLHLGSTLINKYAHRDFPTAKFALEALISRVNCKMTKADTLVHVGDFCLLKHDRHGEVDDVGLDYKLDDYLNMLAPNVLLLAGNHDCSNACEPVAENMWVKLNQNYKHVFVSHFPSYHQFYKGPNCSKWNFGYGIALCGHVHDSWLIHFDKKNNVLNYNVGVDVHNYNPVEDVEITEDLDFIKNAIVPMPKDYLSREEFEDQKKQNSKAIDARRNLRKEERYAKKGLTKEECERRKIEAMRAKGLLK